MEREIMEYVITLKKLKYGERPLTCFSFCFSTCETYLPNFEDLRLAHKETIFERITSNPENLVNSLTHEFLHFWLFENLDKNAALQFENIDKDVLEENYTISNTYIKVPKLGKPLYTRLLHYILRTCRT